MAKEVRFDLNVDASDAERALKDFGRAAKQAGKEAEKAFESSEDASSDAASKWISNMDKVESTTRDTVAIIKLLGDALGDAGKGVDLDKVALSLKRAGLDAKDVEANIDGITNSMKRLGATQAEAQRVANEIKGIDDAARRAESGVDSVGSAARRAGDGTDKLSRSANGANSALANMIGNSTQDMGEMFGVVGSLGVGIGQMGEYAADAALDAEGLGSSLLSMAKVAGPIAALALVTAGVGLAMKALKGDEKEVAENTRELTEAIDDNIGTFDDWKSAIQDAFGAGTAGPISQFTELVASALEKALGEEQFNNLRRNMSNLGQTFSDVAGFVGDGSAAWISYAEGQLRAAGATEQMVAHLSSMIQQGADADAILGDLNQHVANGETLFDQYGNALPLDQMIAFVENNDGMINSVVGLQDTFGKLNIEDAARDFLQLERSITPATRAMVNSAIAATRNADGTINYVRALQEYIRLQQRATREQQRAVTEAEAYAAAIESGAEGRARFNEGLVDTAGSFDDINIAMSNHGDQVQDVAAMWDTLITELADGHTESDAALASWQALQQTLHLNNDEMAALVDQKVAEELEAQAAAAERLGEAIHEATANFDTAESRAAAFAETLDRINDPTALSLTNTEETIGVVNDVQAAIEALGKVDLSESDLITSNWNDLLNEDLQGAIGAVGQLRGSLQSEMAQAFESGGPPELRAWSDSVREGIVSSLAGAGITAEEEVNEVLSALGLLPEQVETTIVISKQEQVLSALETIAGGIEGIPTNKAFDIQMAINNNDPQTALRLINEALPRDEQINMTFAADGTPIITAADTARATVEEDPITLTAEADADQASDDLLDVADEPRTALIVAHARYAGAVNDLKKVADTPRTAYIEAQATGVLKADSQLDGVAKARMAPINTAVFGGISAENALNNIARDRDADIFVRVHGASQAALQVGAIPGVSATALGAPAAVATAGAPSAVTMVAPAPVQHVNVSVNAGVIGNRWDLQRIIARAVRSGQRLNGRRAAA